MNKMKQNFIPVILSILSKDRNRLCRFLFRFRLFVERALGLLDNRFERVCVVDRDVGQNFAIESDAGGLQSLGEAAVSETVRAGGGVESLDPKIAKRALARFAVAIRPILGLHGRVFG